MNIFARFTIATRLALGFGLLFCLAFLYTQQVVTDVADINSNLGQINEVDSVKLQLAVALRENVRQRAVAARDVTLVKLDEDVDTAVDLIAKLGKDYTALQAKLTEMIAAKGATGEEISILAALADGQAKTDEVIANVISLQDRGGNFQARKVFLQQARSNFSAWLAAADKLVAEEQTLNRAAGETVRAATTDLPTKVFKWLAAGLFVALLVAFVSVRSVTGPIGKLRKALQHIAGGQLESDPKLEARKDDIGVVARTVAAIREAAFRSGSQQTLGDQQRSIDVQSQIDKAIQEREASRAHIRQSIAQLDVALEEMAGGNLDYRLDQPFGSALDKLRLNFNTSAETLSSTLYAIGTNVASIDARANEISSASNDLSHRTEQQAMSIERTAAALGQITVNVTKSSKRSDEARTIAAQANATAAQSGKVVANAVDAMQRIEQSSSQISNIIGVIDEIAFQTNLLALNAGVEAARAGEAGKGFAVVAQEVRELAQRSAQAAKEIKSLIRNSSEEVQNGVKLVQETGQVLKTIEGFVFVINEHIDAIATSAREQSVGLSEVNTAINQMDQATQHNAGVVQETSTASAALASDSSRLRELVAQFEAGDDNGWSGGQQAPSRHYAAAASPVSGRAAAYGNAVARVR